MIKLVDVVKIQLKQVNKKGSDTHHKITIKK